MKKKTERHFNSPELYPESNFRGSKDTLPVSTGDHFYCFPLDSYLNGVHRLAVMIARDVHGPEPGVADVIGHVTLLTAATV